MDIAFANQGFSHQVLHYVRHVIVLVKHVMDPITILALAVMPVILKSI
jgi:hypothetical protein